jgi:OOP family OmpA-OmpF porin
MSINLLDLIKDQISGVLAKQASSYLGESESTVNSAIGSLMPTILGSLVQKSSTSSGAQNIMNLIEGLDMNSLGNIAGLFGGGSSNVNSLLSSGGGIVKSLFGEKESGIVDLISGLSGMKSESTSSLLKMAAPLLLSVVGNQIKGNGISALTSLLGGQSEFLKNMLPAGVGSLLGFADFGGNTQSTVTTTSSSSSSNGGGNSWMKWLLPALLGLAVLYYLGTKGCGKKVSESSDELITAIDSSALKATDAMGSAIDSMGAAVGKLFSYKLPSGFELANASEGGIENNLITFIEDANRVVDKETWFDFDHLLFDTGKATLQPESQVQLQNVAEILKAFPKVNLKIGGYTDNQGDPKANLRLSVDRAHNVKNELIKLGIDAKRLEADGYGDKHPIGDNATEEGRQKNRRISVRVTQK